MTAFDTIFKQSAESAGFGTYIFRSEPDRTTHAKYMTKFPMAWRTINEPQTPLYDSFDRVQRDVSVYFVHVGFDRLTTEAVNEGLEDIITRFIEFRDLIQRAGIEVIQNNPAQPSFKTTNFDEFGFIINLTFKYALCLTA